MEILLLIYGIVEEELIISSVGYVSSIIRIKVLLILCPLFAHKICAKAINIH